MTRFWGMRYAESLHQQHFGTYSWHLLTGMFLTHLGRHCRRLFYALWRTLVDDSCNRLFFLPFLPCSSPSPYGPYPTLLSFLPSGLKFGKGWSHKKVGPSNPPADSRCWPCICRSLGQMSLCAWAAGSFWTCQHCQPLPVDGVDEVDDFYEQTLLVSFAPILIGASSRISRQHNIFLIRINLRNLSRMITALVPSHSGICEAHQADGTLCFCLDTRDSGFGWVRVRALCPFLTFCNWQQMTLSSFEVSICTMLHCFPGQPSRSQWLSARTVVVNLWATAGPCLGVGKLHTLRAKTS